MGRQPYPLTEHPQDGPRGGARFRRQREQTSLDGMDAPSTGATDSRPRLPSVSAFLRVSTCPPGMFPKPTALGLGLALRTQMLLIHLGGGGT